MSIIVEEICIEIAKRWPGKYTDPELLDMAQRLAPFPIDAVLQRLEAHKNSNKFKPAISELLSGLRGKETNQRPQASPMAKWLSHGDMLALEMKCEPIEATLRYWRGQWFSYAKQAQRNESKMRQSIPAGPLLDLAIHKWKIQRDGAGRKCSMGCWSGLVACRMDVNEAARWAAATFSAPADFRLAIEDFRHNGIELLPEPAADSFDETDGTLPVFNHQQSVPEFSEALG